jgi:hypothetical protein
MWESDFFANAGENLTSKCHSNISAKHNLSNPLLTRMLSVGLTAKRIDHSFFNNITRTGSLQTKLATVIFYTPTENPSGFLLNPLAQYPIIDFFSKNILFSPFRLFQIATFYSVKIASYQFRIQVEQGIILI